MVSSKKVPESLPKDRVEFKAEMGATRVRKSTKGKQRPAYRRRVKPPYSYAELITMAIKSSPSAMLTLREILEHMSAAYECFRGSYVGWKNSVRHNLSANDCFVKVLRNNQRPYGKDNFWTLAASCPHCLDHGERPAGNASPVQPPSGSPPTLKLARRPPNGSVLHSEEAAAPSPSRLPAAGYEQSAPVRRWPSPTPGCTLGTDAPAPVGQTCDEWSQLEDLFMPDSAIDLALYADDLETALSIQSVSPEPSRLCYPGSAVQDPYSVGLLKPEFSPSIPEYLYAPADYPPHQPGHDLLQQGVTERQLAFSPSLPEYLYAEADYPPYQPGHDLFPQGVTERQLAYPPYITSTNSTNMTRLSTQTPSPRPMVNAGSYRPAGREESAAPGSDGYQLGSIVASAIRGSLSLDLDESALQAIERSVRLLDQPRPSDLICA